MTVCRSVIEYAIMITPNLRRPLMKQLETIQNNCLRIIFKVRRTNRLTNESLREEAKIPKIEDRMKELLERCFERAFVAKNPLIQNLFAEYKEFRQRAQIDTDIAKNKQTNEIDHKLLQDILEHNEYQKIRKKSRPTLLCSLQDLMEEIMEPVEC